jgi:hypothetical protein
MNLLIIITAISGYLLYRYHRITPKTPRYQINLICGGLAASIIAYLLQILYWVTCL